MSYWEHYTEAILDQLARYLGQEKKWTKMKLAWRCLLETVIAEMKKAYLAELERCETGTTSATDHDQN